MGEGSGGKQISCCSYSLVSCGHLVSACQREKEKMHLFTHKYQELRKGGKGAFSPLCFGYLGCRIFISSG